jgi:hypothetical protein
VFFRDEDYQEYLNLLSHCCGQEQVEGWSYCLMPNHAHLSGRGDGVVSVEPLLMRVDDWKGFLSSCNGRDDEVFLRHERTGRPLGDEGFVRRVSKRIGRDLMPKKPGRKKQVK